MNMRKSYAGTLRLDDWDWETIYFTLMAFCAAPKAEKTKLEFMTEIKDNLDYSYLGADGAVYTVHNNFRQIWVTSGGADSVERRMRLAQANQRIKDYLR